MARSDVLPLPSAALLARGGLPAAVRERIVQG